VRKVKNVTESQESSRMFRNVRNPLSFRSNPGMLRTVFSAQNLSFLLVLVINLWQFWAQTQVKPVGREDSLLKTVNSCASVCFCPFPQRLGETGETLGETGRNNTIILKKVRNIPLRTILTLPIIRPNPALLRKKGYSCSAQRCATLITVLPNPAYNQA